MKAIKTENNEERRFLLTMLAAHGFTSQLLSGEDSNDADEIIEDTEHDEFPIILLEFEDMNIDFERCSYQDNLKWPEDASEIIKEILNTPKIIKVELNYDYDALVSKNGVRVGCQTFPFEVIDKVVEAMKAFRE